MGSSLVASEAKPKVAVRLAELSAAIRSATHNLRSAEKLVFFYFTYVTIEALVFPLTLAGRVTVAALNAATSAVLALLARFGNDRLPSTAPPRAQQGSPWAAPSPSLDGRRAVATGTCQAQRSELLANIRNWFPAIIILVAYRESGLFSLGDPSHRLDHLFARWDSLLLDNRWMLAALNLGSPWLQRYLEFSYTLCYPLVPLGMGALYILARRPHLAHRRFDAEGAFDQFWTAVLLALFTCYALFPFFPSTPPRVFFHDLRGPLAPVVRSVNLWILGHYGIQTSVFPSGHVAAVTAVALSVRRHWPAAGIFFTIAAASVALATVVGRYHYAADALAGGLIGVAAFVISKRIHRM